MLAGLILITVLLSAFFSGMEIAYISANKLRLELDIKQSTLSSRVLSLFATNPGQYIVTMLIGNNIALVIYGILMATALDPALRQILNTETWILILQTIISTLIILVLAEFLPKAVFRLKPNDFLKWLGVPVWVFYYAFYPVSRFTIALSNGILKWFFRVKNPGQPVNRVFGITDLQHLVHESDITNEKEEAHSLRIFQNALDFSKVKLRECMVPRTELVALEKNATADEIRDTFIETGLSKILIYDTSLDHIVGYVNIRDYFRNPPSIDKVLHTLPIVPESMPANKLLGTFVEGKKGIALVVDEFGGTSGIVTIEDILEEIFGEIEDEHDSTALTEKQIGKHEYVFSGRLEIDYLNNKYQLGIPEEDDYETLAGYILFRYESLPKPKQVLVIDDYEIKIIKMTETRIDLVGLKKKIDVSNHDFKTDDKDFI